MEVPSYIPLNRDLNRVFEKCGASALGTTQQSDEAADRILKSCRQFLDFALENGTAFDEGTRELLEANTKAMEKIFRTSFVNECFKKAFDKAKSTVRDLNAQEEEVTLDNLDRFHSIARDEKRMNFGDYINKQCGDHANYDEASFNRFLRTKSQYKQLQALAIILENPEAPIPEEGDDGDEEDLGISGGTISLKDPFSLNLFEDPLIAPCKHTFERQTITAHIGTSTDCPIAGCSGKINQRELVPDQLMRLRVRVFKQKGRKDTRVARLE